MSSGLVYAQNEANEGGDGGQSATTNESGNASMSNQTTPAKVSSIIP